jgi:uroporphyrinogen-III synthase
LSPVLVIRPEPGCTATVEEGRTLGLRTEACPLFEIRPLAWQAPSPDEIDALLLGSANAVRQAGAQLAVFRGKPAYAVGETTAAAAEAAGFSIAATGRGGLQALLDAAASAPLRLLRLAGVEHVPVRPPAGVEIDTRAVYEAVPLPLPQAAAERLRRGALVLLHSAAAARHFARECARLAVPRDGIALAALGPRIAAAAGEGWTQVRAATEPREAALLALARDMCHEPRTG